jgi:hypothetical protein
MSKDLKDAARSNLLTHATIRDGLIRNHADMVGAVHQILQNAGLAGLKVSSMRFYALPPAR